MNNNQGEGEGEPGRGPGMQLNFYKIQSNRCHIYIENLHLRDSHRNNIVYISDIVTQTLI